MVQYVFSAVFLVIVRLKDSFAISMEPLWVVKVSTPLLKRFTELREATVPKVTVISDLSFLDDLRRMKFRCFINEVKHHEFNALGGG